MSQNELLFDKSLMKIDYIYRWTGVNIKSQERSRKDNLKYRTIYIINFIWLNTDVLGAVCWFIQAAKRGDSLTSLTYVAPCVALSLLATIKVIFFLIYEDEVNNLITTLRDLERKHKETENSKDKADIVKKELDFLNTVMKVLNFFNWSLIFAFPLMTLMLMGLKYNETGELELMLPFLIVYPFDPFNIKVWPFVYLRQVWSVTLVILKIAAADYLYYICSAYIRVQFLLLQYDIERISVHRVDYQQFRLKLITLIDWHQDLIRLVHFLEVIYSKSTLWNFISSSILICLTGFNVTTIDDVPFVISFLSFLLMSLLQVFFLCFFGDMLMRSSTDVGFAAYNSNWYLMNIKASKDLFLVISRSQKPCKLSAYGFADVNINTFTRILSTSWSYFALLQTVTKNNDLSQ